MKKSKLFAMLTAVALVAAIGVGSTLAYLSDSTEEVTNTFTVGNIDITLDEAVWDNAAKKLDNTKDRLQENSYENLVPGEEVAKDPTITVTSSVPCYVFVSVKDESESLVYDIDSNWTKYADGVYYMNFTNKLDAEKITVLADNKVTVSEDLDKETIDKLVEGKLGTITFKAAAVQKEGFDTVDEAYAEVKTFLQ